MFGIDRLGRAVVEAGATKGTLREVVELVLEHVRSWGRHAGRRPGGSHCAATDGPPIRCPRSHPAATTGCG